MSNSSVKSQRRTRTSSGGSATSLPLDSRLESQYSNLTVSELKQELRKRNLPVSGIKQILVNRLLGAEKVVEYADNQVMSDELSKFSNGPTNVTQEHFDVKVTDEMDNTYKQILNDNQQICPEALKRQRQLDRERRQQIVLWKKPIVTLQYFLLELLIIAQKEKRNILKHKKTCSSITAITLFVTLIYFIEGAHQEYFVMARKLLFWCSYWVGLGILSSVGLGTGLHTFLLYLGPHIAQVTLAAWECDSLDFPEPPYPDEILCPSDNHKSHVNMWTIMSKVRLEAFMWGAGTAIGELPPYFMARAARLSGTDADDEDIEKLEELISSESKDLFTRAKRFIPQLVERVGFFGILACASIPNPLFDLAGITCGHCLVPFWTFFGATLIGKAVIKMHIQQTFVILCFSKTYVKFVLQMLGLKDHKLLMFKVCGNMKCDACYQRPQMYPRCEKHSAEWFVQRKIPVIGQHVQAPFERAVQVQIEKLHRDPSKSPLKAGTNVLGWIFEKLVTIMIVYFLLSIVNSLAQSYCKRLDDQKRQVNSGKVDKDE